MSSIPANRPLRYESDFIGNDLLNTWQEEEHNRWAFNHMTEVTTHAVISKNEKPSEGSAQLGKLGDRLPSLLQRLNDTYTDALVIMQGGEILAEYYAPGTDAHTPHLLMSVSKSLCGIVAGSLQDQGKLEVNRLVVDYVPELAGSAYNQYTVSQVLDMLVPVRYDENYVDPTSEVQRHDRSAKWRPALADDPSNNYEFLSTLQALPKLDQDKFQYCSANTDVIAWVIERVTGQRYAEVLSELLWSKLDAEHDALISVDQEGFGFANGGVSCTARDLALVGKMMLQGGLAARGRVVSESWVRSIFSGGNPEAMAHDSFAVHFPGASYTRQWWCTGNERGIISGIGIHGQNLWIDPSQELVIVKLSSWPEPDTDQWHTDQSELLLDMTEGIAQIVEESQIS